MKNELRELIKFHSGYYECDPHVGNRINLFEQAIRKWAVSQVPGERYLKSRDGVDVLNNIRGWIRCREQTIKNLGEL